MTTVPERGARRHPAPSTGRRNLVFTSAGHHAAIRHWTTGRRNFDLWIVDYTETPGRHRHLADAWWSRRGSKFQNLHALWRSDPQRLARYDAVMVLDDDIRIDGDSLSALFDLRERFSLSVLQPAFQAPSKISHPLTARQRDFAMRYTDFVEMNCPLFRRSSLERFLRDYDPSLLGYGIDHWYMNVLRAERDFRCAIIDAIPCVNPPDAWKGGVREIDALMSEDDRRTNWERLRDERGLEEVDTRRTHGTVRLPLWSRMAIRMDGLLPARHRLDIDARVRARWWRSTTAARREPAARLP